MKKLFLTFLALALVGCSDKQTKHVGHDHNSSYLSEATTAELVSLGATCVGDACTWADGTTSCTIAFMPNYVSFECLDVESPDSLWCGATIATAGGQTDLCAGVTCSPLDACHIAGTCDPMTGLCSNPLADDGTLCSDGNACTSSDVCTAGVCGGVNVADWTACDDGDVCTQGDACYNGSCSAHLVLTAALAGSKVIPSGAGDLDGVGELTLTFDPIRVAISWVGWWTGIDQPTRVHIHVGEPTQTGLDLIPLYAQAGSIQQTTFYAQPGTSNYDRIVANTPSIVLSPRAHYYNAHVDPAYAAGAIRDQLSEFVLCSSNIPQCTTRCND